MTNPSKISYANNETLLNISSVFPYYKLDKTDETTVSHYKEKSINWSDWKNILQNV